MVCRQKSDRCGGCAHDPEGRNKSDPPADEIAHTPKEQRAEWPNEKSHSEGRKIGDQRKCVVTGRIKFDGENRCERAENIEVVPLDQGSGGRAQNDLGERSRCDYACAAYGKRRHSLIDLAKCPVNLQGDAPGLQRQLCWLTSMGVKGIRLQIAFRRRELGGKQLPWPFPSGVPIPSQLFANRYDRDVVV